jgi:autoinducer 2-degrading protein
MRLVFLFLLGAAIVPSTLWAQVGAEAPADIAVYAVSYVDVMPSARKAALAALSQYRETSRKDAGYRRFDFFEQIGRPGHLAIIEAWTDQKSFDAHGAAAHTKDFLSTLQPLRTSGYDQRPYRTLTVGSAPAATNGQALHIVAHVDTANPPTDALVLLRRFADASRKDEGSVRFDILQHAVRANHFTVVETWRNQKALEAHAAAAHTREYREKLQPMSGSPLDERIYKAVE